MTLQQSQKKLALVKIKKGKIKSKSKKEMSAICYIARLRGKQKVTNAFALPLFINDGT